MPNKDKVVADNGVLNKRECTDVGLYENFEIKKKFNVNVSINRIW